MVIIVMIILFSHLNEYIEILLFSSIFFIIFI